MKPFLFVWFNSLFLISSRCRTSTTPDVEMGVNGLTVKISLEESVSQDRNKRLTFALSLSRASWDGILKLKTHYSCDFLVAQLCDH